MTDIERIEAEIEAKKLELERLQLQAIPPAQLKELTMPDYVLEGTLDVGKANLPTGSYLVPFKRGRHTAPFIRVS